LKTATPSDRDGGLERHAAYYADLAEAVRRRSSQGDAEAARRAVEEDRDNFVAILERIVSSPVLGAAAAKRALRVLVSVYAVPGAMPQAAFLSIVDAAVDRTKDSGADPSLVAQALVVRARARRANGDDKGATRDLLRALPVATSVRRRDIEADATAELAHLLANGGQLEAAVDHARRASLAYRETGDRIGEAVAAANAGDFERRRGRIDDARAALERALPLGTTAPGGNPPEVLAAALRLFLETRDDKALYGTIAQARAKPVAPVHQEAALLFVEGVALQDHGETTAARERYAAADEHARRAGAPLIEGEIALFDALAALELGSWGNALARLRSATDIDARGWIAGDIAELARALAFAVDAVKNPAWRGPAPLIRRSRYARELIGAAEAAAFDHYGTMPADDADDRIVARLFARAMARESGAPARTDAAPDAATFDLDGRWFRLPAEPTVTLEKRRPIASMLKLLVAERLARPGSSVSVEQLLAAGWPGERVLPDAGAHRVRVALSTLRKLGLKSVLVTTPTGYVLDPSQKVVTANEAPA
ncbi:MAG: hypothetical protein HOV80_38850, partial [Polyangiaceae bacterium]|nr:hypothetical protein [Polyangiaceae bacterium]